MSGSRCGRRSQTRGISCGFPEPSDSADAPAAVLVPEFPDTASAEAWRNDPEFPSIREMRNNGVHMDFLAVGSYPRLSGEAPTTVEW